MTETDPQSLEDVQAAYAACVDDYDGIQKSYGNGWSRTFIGIDTNTSVRSEFSSSDYDWYRNGEAVPKDQREIMRMAMLAYDKVGIVHNMIDMMADFTVQGIRIIHPNKKIENFHKNWAKIIGLKIVSERIANYLYRVGNVPIKVRYGTVNSAIETEWRKNFAATTEDVKLQKPKVDRRRIPLGYNFLNPLTLEIIGGELATFVGTPIYALKINTKLRQDIRKFIALKHPTANQKDLISVLPDILKQAVIDGKSVIPLDQDKVRMLHFKKDDWLPWANPMVHPVLSNLILLEKMHLADMSALDGAISSIRLWRLGSIEYEIYPQRAAVNKLRDLLAKMGMGVLDLVWGPDLDFKETDTKVHQFLGEGKYKQVMDEIHMGMGIPRGISGSAATGSTSSYNNNAISMRTLIERLEHGRDIITDFWDQELKQIQRAMGWRFPAKVVFDYKVLSDDAAMRKLLMDMWDREILSTETLREKFEIDPEMEGIRVGRERKSREAGLSPQKASPYHNPQTEDDLKKILLQNGGVTPSELGIELEERKPGEKTKLEQDEETQIKVAKMKPKPAAKKASGPNGRPKNAKDSRKRKTKTVTPKTTSEFISLFAWANEAQDQISTILAPGMLKQFNKKNVRSFTKEEAETFEYIKLSVLYGLQPYSQINEETVYSMLDNNVSPSPDILQTCKTLAYVFKLRHGKEPSVTQMREIQSSAYALEHEESSQI